MKKWITKFWKFSDFNGVKREKYLKKKGYKIIFYYNQIIGRIVFRINRHLVKILNFVSVLSIGLLQVKKKLDRFVQE